MIIRSRPSITRPSTPASARGDAGHDIQSGHDYCCSWRAGEIIGERVVEEPQRVKRQDVFLRRLFPPLWLLPDLGPLILQGLRFKTKNMNRDDCTRTVAPSLPSFEFTSSPLPARHAGNAMTMQWCVY